MVEGLKKAVSGVLRDAVQGQTAISSPALRVQLAAVVIVLASRSGRFKVAEDLRDLADLVERGRLN